MTPSAPGLKPASASSARARSGLNGSGLTSRLYAQLPGANGPEMTVPWPLKNELSISWRLTATAIASRTRRSASSGLREQHHLAVAGHGLEHVRPGADRAAGERVLARQVLRVRRAVLGDDLEAELRQRVQDRPLERAYHRVVAGLLDLVDELVAHLERRDGLRVHHDVVGEHHVVGGERPRLLALARVPLHVLAEKERVDAAVLRRFPALGQLRHDFLLLVDADQTAEHQLRDAQRDRLVAGDRVERRRPAVLAVVEDAAVGAPVGLRRGVRRNAQRARRAQYCNSQDRFHTSLAWLALKVMVRSLRLLKVSSRHRRCAAPWSRRPARPPESGAPRETPGSSRKRSRDPRRTSWSGSRPRPDRRASPGRWPRSCSCCSCRAPPPCRRWRARSPSSGDDSCRARS